MDDRGLWWGGQETYIQPLAYEPGTSYQYSSSVDWAGFLIERIKNEIMARMMKPCELDSETGELTVNRESPMGKPTKPEDVSVFSG